MFDLDSPEGQNFMAFWNKTYTECLAQPLPLIWWSAPVAIGIGWGLYALRQSQPLTHMQRYGVLCG